MNTEVVVLRGGRRASIRKDHYESIRDFIVALLEEQGEIPLMELLQRCEERFTNFLKPALQWYVLSIKHDLEARAIIRIRYDDLVQCIALQRKYKERLLDPMYYDSIALIRFRNKKTTV
jgi:hypothetical protein